ncbi:MAG: sulfatase-like hydrolase/transferase [Planctomycetota bacterium]|jgi:arylsulfatase A-like enzyme
MNRPLSAALLLLATLTVAARCDAASEKPNSEKPNIVYIMSDELAYYEVSYMGHPQLKTPRIDRMASEGLRFTQALAGSPVCAPLRCNLMTGKHAGHASIRANGGGTPLRAGEPTIASMLGKLGYATGGFGKWGCGGRGSTGVPEEHGFDTFFGYYDQVHAHSFYPPYLIHNSKEVPLKGNVGGRSGETYSHYVIMDQALDFIRDNREQPFFCYLPITPPHGMFDIPDSDPAVDLYREKVDWPEEARNYAAMVSMVDRQVGEVLDLLKNLGLEDNTIVFFAGDNGGQDRFRSPEHPRGFFGPNVNPQTGVEFRGGKGNLYEGGLRIPSIVRWPGRIKPGRVSDLVWYHPDVLPTLAELTGATAPDDIDGMSILPELLGAEATGRKQASHEYLYWEFGQQTAVRMGHWKAIQPGAKADWELYDLHQDVSETDSVAAQHPEILKQMQAFAAASHEDAVEGIFHDRADHEKDRRAKWGTSREAPKNSANVNSLPTDGLIPSDDWKLVRFSSENKGNRKLAANAIDGDPRTIWHTQFQPRLDRHPHELVIDLAAEYSIRGFHYLARQDGGWNGAIAQCEFSVSNNADTFPPPVVTATFGRTRTAQTATCKPTRGRYVLIRSMSELNGGPWASAAEFGVVGSRE